ncbi:MAG: RNA pseudouridine synthase [Polyangiaceae bacterium]|nr:RNA pseudouridine synthase [Polyangiaceae bacterium]
MTAADLAVLFASDDVVVVNKPSGIATEPDKSGATSLRDLVARWLASRKMTGTPHAVSRLDVGVSGAVTFAFSDAGKKAAAQAKEAGRFQRRYIALAAGELPERGLVDKPIEGKPASTGFRRIAVARAAKHAPVSLVVFEPRTGRTHQIRIHATHARAPIIGDRRYGGVASVVDPRGRVHAVERVLLHAAAVRFDLGAGSNPPSFIVAPTPAEMLALWSCLDGSADAWEEVAACFAGSPREL